MLKGQWLKDWGFEIDDAIVVKCEDGKLVISKAEADEQQAITGVSQMVAGRREEIRKLRMIRKSESKEAMKIWVRL